jgi:cytochrome c oxidase cbb3-type subunit 3/ubiquinol-cytochrome c reductase cytochrome c subunit
MPTTAPVATAEGRGGAAIALADPVYLAIADDASMRERHRQRRARNVDAAFAQAPGGMLTDEQIE